MKPIYKKLLKELEKGNAVLLEANGLNRFSRYRIVTPNNCEYDFLDALEKSEINQSCFINFLPVKPLNPKLIVKKMEEFDGNNGLKITKMQVLK